MVANKHTKKEVILFCDEISSLLSGLKINETDKKNIKKYDKLYKQSEKCKNLINGKNNLKSDKKKTNYKNYIEDCFLIKKGQKTSGILSKDIEDELFNDINKHNNSNYFSIFGKFWKNRINEDIKNKYKDIKDQDRKNVTNEENIKHRGRPKKSQQTTK